MIKRFISGAICPKCNKKDCIVSFIRNDTQTRECVECGFSDNMNLAHSITQQPKTRLNHNKTITKKQDTIEQPIRFVE